MAGPDRYDILIIGGGTGGYSCALRAAQLGMSVGLVEKHIVGGTCLHLGCIPTKALLQTAEVAEHAKEAGEFGVQATFEGIEVRAVHEYKNAVVGSMTRGLQATLKSRGVRVIRGHGRLVDARTVDVEGEDGGRYTADAIVVAPGSVPREIPPAPYDGTRIIHSDHALSLDFVPERALVLGAGAVGMEFASIWRAFGSEVMVVEMEERLLPLEDPDVSREIQRQFRRQGIQSMTGATLTSVAIGEAGVVATIAMEGGEEQVGATILLVAVGRRPRTENVGLEEVGVELEKGFIKVDEYCRTNLEGIWAVGDAIPTLGLAHASFMEGILVADQLYGLDVIPIDYAGVPRVTFCHPEVASVGLTGPQAQARGHEVEVKKFPFQHIARAQMMKQSGLVKLVAARDGQVLGIHLVGPRATDLIAEAELIYNWEALPIDVARFIHPHPTLNEAIGEAHLALAGRGLHSS
ncbi:MAG: dihydrolipoyl dehydrogenase [Actinomycetota bacterium]|nr:dihydrolipoyl dehydrogenase [Actinomycetota bacterium]